MNDRLLKCAGGGRSILVGTVDADGAPTCCRAIAIQPNGDFTRLTVYIPVATGQETIANIATTRKVAVVSCNPPDHDTTQFKGSTIAVRMARPDEAEFVRTRLESFAETLELLGLPKKITLRLNHWPAFAVEMNVEQVFEQTPGPAAGNPLQ